MALLATVLYIAALLAPYHTASKGLNAFDGYGWIILIFGWEAVLGFSIAWLANFLFFFCIIKMAMGKPPPFKPSSIGLGIALTSLLPFHGYSGADGFSWDRVVGAALWLWLASFACVWLWAWSIEKEKTGRNFPRNEFFYLKSRIRSCILTRST